MGIEESKLWKCYKAVPFWVVIAYPIYCPMLQEQSNNGATTNLQLRTERKGQSAIEDLLLGKKIFHRSNLSLSSCWPQLLKSSTGTLASYSTVARWLLCLPLLVQAIGTGALAGHADIDGLDLGIAAVQEVVRAAVVMGTRQVGVKVNTAEQRSRSSLVRIPARPQVPLWRTTTSISKLSSISSCLRYGLRAVSRRDRAGLRAASRRLNRADTREVSASYIARPLFSVDL